MSNAQAEEAGDPLISSDDVSGLVLIGLGVLMFHTSGAAPSLLGLVGGVVAAAIVAGVDAFVDARSGYTGKLLKVAFVVAIGASLAAVGAGIPTGVAASGYVGLGLGAMSDRVSGS